MCESQNGLDKQEESLHLWHGICNQDVEARQQAIAQVVKIFENFLESQTNQHQVGINDSFRNGHDSAGLRNGTVDNVHNRTEPNSMQEHLLVFLRLSVTCPFEDIQKRCSIMLQELKVNIVLKLVSFLSEN